jgi:hypothetical protein
MKTIPFPKRRCTGVLLGLLLLCSLAAGCGKPKGSVSGKVTFKGKPLTAGFVIFTPEKGPAVNASINSEGKYKAENVPVGTAKISVRTDAVTDSESFKMVKNPKDPKEMRKLKPQSTGPKIPWNSKYNDPEQSGLTYTVQEGPQEHDIDLK